MESRTEWIPVGHYGAGYEVDFAVATLESAGIPHVVKGRESGIWGPAFAGPTSQGMSVWVPAEFEEEAREILAPAGDAPPPA
jgi:hypothetical protein